MKTGRRAAASLLLTTITLLFAACGGGIAGETEDIVSRVPWVQSESHDYVLKDKSGRVFGTAVLSVNREGATTTLVQRFSDLTGENTDTTSVIVDSQTLKPRSATRVITTGPERDELVVTYTDEGVIIRHRGKQSGLSLPEHAYDNDTSLFIWRTIPFEEGHVVRYMTIITNRRNAQKVEVSVRGRERVTVPAGTFDAWRLEIRSADVRQVAWYADTPARTLIRYDNSRGTVFELQGAMTAGAER